MNLKGIDALNKASKLMESLMVSERKDSFSNVEKVYNAANGKTYGIVKEGAKYIIKEAVNNNANSPEDFDYIQGVQNKAKYSKETILEAEKTLHLWNIEFQRTYGDKFLKEEAESKKMVLKVPAKRQEEPVADMSAEAPVEAPVEMPAEEAPIETDVPAEGGEMEAGMGEEMSVDGAEEMDDTSDEDDPVKLIQKLAGKLSYELRQFQGADEEYGDVANFALGMVAAAVDSEKLSSSDIKKLKKKIDKNLKKSADELDLDYPGAEEDMAAMDAEEMPETEEEVPVDAEEAPEGSEEELNESLEGKSAKEYIDDFIKSDDPKFKGKSKKKRRDMALAAYYADQRKGKKEKKSLKEFKDYFMEEDDDVYFDEDDTESLLLDTRKDNVSYDDEDLFEFEDDFSMDLNMDDDEDLFEFEDDFSMDTEEDIFEFDMNEEEDYFGEAFKKKARW